MTMRIACIEVQNHLGQAQERVNALDLIDLIIQDDEIGLDILNDLVSEGRYEFTGDGMDETTDQILVVVDAEAAALQLVKIQAMLDAE